MLRDYNMRILILLLAMIGMARADMMAYNKELGYVADIEPPYTGLTYYSQKVGLNQDCALSTNYVRSGFLNVAGSWIQIFWVSLPSSPTKDCFQVLDDFNPVKNVLTNMGDNDKIYTIDSGVGFCKYTVSENHPCAEQEFAFGGLSNGASYTNGQNFKEYAPVAAQCLSGTDTGETTIAADEYAHLRMCLVPTRPTLYDILESDSTVTDDSLHFVGTNYDIHIEYFNDGSAGRWELDSNGNYISYGAGSQRAWATWIVRKDGANVFQTDDPFLSCNEAIHNETARCDQDLGFTAISTTPEGDVCWLGGRTGVDNVRYMRLGTLSNPNSDWLNVQHTTVLNGCYYKVPWVSGKNFTTVHTAAGAEPNCIGNERTVDFTEVNRIDRIEHLNSPMAPGEVWKRTCPTNSSNYVNFVCTNGIAKPTYTGPCATCRVDVIGVCGGSCVADDDSDGICDDVDDCVGAYDECGVCNGPGIPQGQCDCDGNVLDAIGECGGSCAVDADDDDICDNEDPCVGTLDAIDVCNGNCTADADNDGICDNEDDCIGTLDAIDVCNGNCTADVDDDDICDNVDPCVGALDVCGVCNGPGIPQDQCDCYGNVLDECGVCNGSGIPSGQCDCNGNVLDAIGECGGSCTADADLDNICDDVDSCLLGCKELRPTGETIGNVSDPKISWAAINNLDYFDPTNPEVPPPIESMPKIVFGANANECLTKFKTDFPDVFQEYIKESTADYDLNGAGDEVLGDKYAFGHYYGKCYFAYVNGHPNIDPNIHSGHHGGDGPSGPSEPSSYQILSYGTGCTVLNKHYTAEGCDSTCGNSLSTTCVDLLTSYTSTSCTCT